MPLLLALIIVKGAMSYSVHFLPPSACWAWLDYKFCRVVRLLQILIITTDVEPDAISILDEGERCCLCRGNYTLQTSGAVRD